MRVTFDLDVDEERDTSLERETPLLLERADVRDVNELPPDERMPEFLKPLPAAYV
jgi:hypothetical protein